MATCRIPFRIKQNQKNQRQVVTLAIAPLITGPMNVPEKFVNR